MDLSLSCGGWAAGGGGMRGNEGEAEGRTKALGWSHRRFFQRASLEWEILVLGSEGDDVGGWESRGCVSWAKADYLMALERKRGHLLNLHATHAFKMYDRESFLSWQKRD